MNEELREPRNIVVRLVSLAFWIVLGEAVGNIVAGQLVIHMSGYDLSSREGMASALYEQMKFAASYGGVLMLSIFVFVGILAYLGWLPGVKKFK